MVRVIWTEEKISALQVEGRGKGVRERYQPWVQVQDFSSLGNSRRVFSAKTGRVHHLLSDVEWGLFLLLEHAPNVLDIREQFPLPREDTQSLAVIRQIKHPVYPSTKVPMVMTCDFLVTFERNGERTLAAFACKRGDAFEKERTLQLLELERAYFDGVGVPHHLVLHERLPRGHIRNLIWCRGATTNSESEAGTDGFEEHYARIRYELTRHTRSETLAEYAANYETRTGAEPGLGLRVLRAMLWDRTLLTDMNQPSLPEAPLAMFRLAESAAQHARAGG